MNSETDHTTFSVTGLRTLIQHREEELNNMPEQIRVRLARGADQLQLSEWETEKRGRLRQEIGEMQTRIAARYRQAGIPIPASDKGGDNITLIPTATPPIPATPTMSPKVRATYDAAMKATLAPAAAPAVRQQEAQQDADEEQPAEEPSADDLMEGARQRSLRRKQRQLDGR